ncbi:MAG TPA: DUF6596 domain-containing protein, partial [Thermoanaerobaculia bacterium]
KALLALMLLQASRTPARVDAHGELITLEEQDRASWDQAMRDEGLRMFGSSATGTRLTAYHVEAAIAAIHAAAPSFDETDWPALVSHYDDLIALKPTPVVALNRGVALAMAQGPAAGIAALDDIAAHPSMRDYTPLAIALGELHLRNGDRKRAAEFFTRALDLPGTMAEKRFVLRKLRGAVSS